MRRTPAGVGRATGPATSVTCAPIARAAAATAKPIFPELRLPMNRTGSMSSNVGPALTSTRLPASRGGSADSDSAATMASGSSSRPAPTSPQAWSPSAGPSTSTPRDTSVARLARVAGWAHITRFIAGAIVSGASLARQSVLSRSLARPWARRAIVLAVHGAIRMRVAQRASSMWPMAASAASSHSELRTGWPDRAWNVVGPTKCSADAVITTRTWAPASCRRRSSSAAL